MFDKSVFRFPAPRDWFDIQGYVHRGFEDVREAFEQNFVRRGELGGACCVYVRGGEGCRPLGRHSEQAQR